MSKYKITVDRNLCIGAATCVALAPKAFQLDDQGKAVVVPTANEETDETIMNAAQSCPVAAIILEEIATGKKSWPK